MSLCSDTFHEVFVLVLLYCDGNPDLLHFVVDRYASLQGSLLIWQLGWALYATCIG